MKRFLIAFITAPIVVIGLVWIMSFLITFKPPKNVEEPPLEVVLLSFDELPLKPVVAEQETSEPSQEQRQEQSEQPKQEKPKQEEQQVAANPTQTLHLSSLIEVVEFTDIDQADEVSNEHESDAITYDSNQALIDVVQAETKVVAQVSQPSGTRLTPMYTLKPKYPSRARRQGIEGFVELIFDVSPIGTVENIRVNQAKPKNMFERYAIRALKQWKYEPLIIDGVKHSYKNKKVLLDFKLEN